MVDADGAAQEAVALGRGGRAVVGEVVEAGTALELAAAKGGGVEAVFAVRLKRRDYWPC